MSGKDNWQHRKVKRHFGADPVLSLPVPLLSCSLLLSRKARNTHFLCHPWCPLIPIGNLWVWFSPLPYLNENLAVLHLFYPDPCSHEPVPTRSRNPATLCFKDQLLHDFCLQDQIISLRASCYGSMTQVKLVYFFLQLLENGFVAFPPELNLSQ